MTIDPKALREMDEGFAILADSLANALVRFYKTCQEGGIASEQSYELTAMFFERINGETTKDSFE